MTQPHLVVELCHSDLNSSNDPNRVVSLCAHLMSAHSATVSVEALSSVEDVFHRHARLLSCSEPSSPSSPPTSLHENQPCDPSESLAHSMRALQESFHAALCEISADHIAESDHMTSSAPAPPVEVAPSVTDPLCDVTDNHTAESEQKASPTLQDAPTPPETRPMEEPSVVDEPSGPTSPSPHYRPFRTLTK